MPEDLLDKPSENFFDSELESYIKEIMGDTEIAIVLSSNYDKVHGYYPTAKTDENQKEPEFLYKGRNYQSKYVAHLMAKRDILELQKFWPYFLFNSMKPTKSGEIYRLLIAINLAPEQMSGTESSIGQLREIIEQRWYNVNNWPLLLE
jgi:hypothetical protein